jgi:heat shock protein HtpX
LLAPIAALLLRAAISRKREALADATAVQFTRNPTGLRRALETLAADSTVVHQKSTAVAHVWIESPLDGKSKSMFDTHPPLAARIALLREMEGAPPAVE